LETQATDQVKSERSGAGMTLGIITFLVGVALLLATFKMAYDMFSVPPGQVIATGQNNSVDLGRSGDNLVNVVMRVLLLIVMGLMGSLIANRGVSMFTSSRTKRAD
jgi:hypothetical protein